MRHYKPNQMIRSSAANHPDSIAFDIGKILSSFIRTRIKVCCIVSPEEARAAIEAGVDALELVACVPSGSGLISDGKIAEVTSIVAPPVATFLLNSKTTADAISAHARGGARMWNSRTA